VPLFDYRGERDQLRRWVEAKPFEEWARHRRKANAVSLDGLPGLSPRATAEG
jgi:hypothetical protein